MSDDDVYVKSFRAQLDSSVLDAFDTDRYELVDWIRVLWSGWEADSFLALVRLPDGRMKAVFADGTANIQDFGEMLEERIAAYEDTAAKTRAFLQKLKQVNAG